MDIKKFKICENPIAKSKHMADPRMVFSKDVVRFNTPATRILTGMGCVRAEIYVDAENKRIALVGCTDGGVKLQETGVRMLREMDKALGGLYEFNRPKQDRVTWGNNWGYSKYEYATTKVAEIDTETKAIVFDISDCERLD